MKYQRLGNTDIQVSKIALGAWGLGGGSVWTDYDITVQETRSLLERCMELGVNYIDTAPVYGTGKSEQLLGKALEGIREHFVVQTKCSLNWRNEGGNFHYSRDGYTINNDTRKHAIRQDVLDSLNRMGLEYIDSLIVHYVCEDFAVEETVEVLEELVKEGKIRTYGLSNSQPNDLQKYQACGGHVAVVQEFFSILSPFHGRDYFPMCDTYNTTFQVYGVLEEGFLTGPDFLQKSFAKTDIRSRIPWVEEKYRLGLQQAFEQWKPLCEKYQCSYANLVQSWAISQYENLSLLVGMRKISTLEDTCRSLDITLDEQDIIFMEQTIRDIQVVILDK